jgi:hypothetical protein
MVPLHLQQRLSDKERLPLDIAQEPCMPPRGLLIVSYRSDAVVPWIVAFIPNFKGIFYFAGIPGVNDIHDVNDAG